jgi:hypothetical protein
MTGLWLRRTHLLLALLLLAPGCEKDPVEPNGDDDPATERSPRLALWLAKKGELIGHESAAFDLVMTGWIEPAEAQAMRERHPSAALMAGLTLHWVADDPAWRGLLVTVANGGDPNGPLQITDDMVLMFDDNDDGVLDRRCNLPGWTDPEIFAMDPRHPGWQELILSFYDVVAGQPQHDGVIVDMVDAYPFCDGAWSAGMPVPLDAQAWIAGQAELLRMLRERVPAGKRIIANAGLDFPEGSPFPQYLNGYLLENALGTLFGLELGDMLASAERALASTRPPHTVVFSVDTDDTGNMDWRRFRTGLAASLLMDHTYFAFDFGPRDHGGVRDYWFPDYYDVALGEPLGVYDLRDGIYRRDFENGVVVIAAEAGASVSLGAVHLDVATGSQGADFQIPKGDARIFVRR